MSSPTYYIGKRVINIFVKTYKNKFGYGTFYPFKVKKHVFAFVSFKNSTYPQLTLLSLLATVSLSYPCSPSVEK